MPSGVYAFLHDLRHKSANLFRRVLLHFLRHVCVDIQRELRRVVTQHPGDCLGVYAVLQCHSGEGPAQIMEANVFFDTRPFQ